MTYITHRTFRTDESMDFFLSYANANHSVQLGFFKYIYIYIYVGLSHCVYTYFTHAESKLKSDNFDSLFNLCDFCGISV